MKGLSSLRVFLGVLWSYKGYFEDNSEVIKGFAKVSKTIIYYYT